MRTFLLLALVIIFSACKTLDPLESYTFKKENLKLPFLIPEADLNNINLAMHYNQTASTEGPKYNELSFFDKYKNYDQELAFKKEQRINDVLRFYMLELEKHMEIDTTNPIGKIQLRIIDFKEKRKPALMMANLYLLGIPSLFGVPFNIIDIYIEINLNIASVNGEIKDIYLGKGYARETMAMYWGYGADAYRSATLKAFRSALSEAMDKIHANQKNILEKLQ